MSEPAPIPYTTVPKCPKCATALHRVSRECGGPSGSERWTAPAARWSRESDGVLLVVCPTCSHGLWMLPADHVEPSTEPLWTRRTDPASVRDAAGEAVLWAKAHEVGDARTMLFAQLESLRQDSRRSATRRSELLESLAELDRASVGLNRRRTSLEAAIRRLGGYVFVESPDGGAEVPYAESTPGTNPLPDRPASPPITGLPHMLAQEMPTDPALPAITLDDAAVEPIEPDHVNDYGGPEANWLMADLHAMSAAAERREDSSIAVGIDEATDRVESYLDGVLEREGRPRRRGVRPVK